MSGDSRHAVLPCDPLPLSLPLPTHKLAFVFQFIMAHGHPYIKKTRMCTDNSEVLSKMQAAGEGNLQNCIAMMGRKLVHLDLKGAPPRVSYLAQVFPIFSSLGANGLLIEYEDMFPYEGELECLRATHAYSRADIEEILSMAEEENLEVIPLVQTFGHLEFVLKHKKFSHLREVASLPNALNPHKKESLTLVKAMLKQVMDAHSSAKWLHIGSDEVYYLGEGVESQKLIVNGAITLDQLFLKHVEAVARYVKTSFPAVTPIMWDDMLRKANEQDLKDSVLPKLVEPMVWCYFSDLDVKEKVSLIEMYGKCGFSKVWLASAFKGATAANQMVTDIGYHVENQLRWLEVAKSELSCRIQGIALTGWQRFDHFSVLCELLPIGLPSLAVCLQVLLHGGWIDTVKEDVQLIMGLPDTDISNITSFSGSSFPGSELIPLVLQVSSHLKTSVDALLEKNSFVTGWFSPYHRKRQVVHPIMVGHFQPEANGLLNKWTTIRDELQAALDKIYYPDSSKEWLEECICPTLERLEEFLVDLAKALASDSSQQS